MSVIDATLRPTVRQTMEGQREPIGERLKRLRLARGLSQRDLSSPGVSYAYISRIEAGARTPSVKALRMLAQKLNVSVEYLETGRDLRESDERELKLGEAELELRLAQDTAAAERILNEVYEEAARAGDTISAARAQIALGLAAAQRGSYLDAVERLEKALQQNTLTPASRPDVFATLGQSYAQLGAPDRAVALFERCVSELDEIAPGDVGTHIRFATYLSYALSDAGEYERAEEVVREALRRGEDATDPYSRVRLHWSLARTAGLEGKSLEALQEIRHAIALLEVTEHTTQLARAYLMSAGIEVREGREADARDHLDSAERLLGGVAEPIDRGMIHTGRSRLAALEGDGAAAVTHARKSLDILGTFAGGEQGAAVWALANGLALQGDREGALDAYQRAVDLLVVHGRRNDAAEAATEWGRFLQECGRADEAESVLQRAADLGLKAEAEAHRKR